MKRHLGHNMKILALDTSGLTATVALSQDDRLVSQFSIQHKTTHSQILMPMMDAIKTMTDLDLSTIDAIAVAEGPGSFTGLRIGAATAKALCLALEVPLVAIPTMDGLAYNMYGTEQIICPMMDARRSQVYTGVYTFVPEKDETTHLLTYTMHTILPQKACSIEEITDYLNQLGRPAVLLGDGVPVYMDELEKHLTVPFYEAPLQMNRQSAASLCALAAQYIKEGRTADADSFAPDYLRPSQAERTAAENAGRTETAAPKVPERVFIRPIKAEDMDAAAALEKENLGREAWTLPQLLNASVQDDTIYLVAEKAGTIVGLCGVQNISGDGEITNVSVSTACRGEGIGTKMLRQLMERGRGIGIENYTLEVRSQNAPARRLYEKLGFTSDGKRPNFYDAPKDDAEIYWLRKNEVE